MTQVTGTYFRRLAFLDSSKLFQKEPMLYFNFQSNFLVVLSRSEYLVVLPKKFISINQIFIDVQQNSFFDSRKVVLCVLAYFIKVNFSLYI